MFKPLDQIDDPTDLDRLGAYIDTILVTDFQPDMLFIYGDIFSQNVKCVFQNPFEILRDFWKTHLQWHSYDENYANTVSYLISKIYESQYFMAGLKLYQLSQKKEKITLNYMNEVAYLYLVQQSSLYPGLLFGYSKIPEQTFQLGQMLFSAGFRNIDDLIKDILSQADDIACTTVKAFANMPKYSML